MRKTSKKSILNAILALINVVLVIIFWSYNYDNVSIEQILVWSRISLCMLAVNLVFWKKLTGTLLCPYIVLMVTVAVFCSGQVYAWALGWTEVEYIFRNLLGANSNASILFSLHYTLNSINFMHLGACLIVNDVGDIKKLRVENNILLMQSFVATAKILICISAGPFILKSVHQLINGFLYGYSGTYADDELTKTRFGFLITTLSNYFMPSMIILLADRIYNKKNHIPILLLCIISIIPTFYSGGRSPGVMLLLAVFMTYVIFKSNDLKVSTIAKYGVLGYFGLVITAMISDIRKYSGKNLETYIDAFFEHFSSAIQSILFELGWSFSSVVYTSSIVPETYSYRYGLSYLWGTLNAIPNLLGQWGNNVNKYSNLSLWLSNIRNTGSGTGYTIIAETYINFGKFGIVLMLLWGLLFGLLLHKKIYKGDGMMLMSCMMVLLFMTIVIKSIVRSDISNTIRILVYNLLPFYIITISNYNKKSAEKSK